MLDTFVTQKGFLAVTQPVFSKIEPELKGGFAVNANRINMVEVTTLIGHYLDGRLLPAGTKIALRGDAGLQSWAKQKFVLNGVEFVMCPESTVFAYRLPEGK